MARTGAASSWLPLLLILMLVPAQVASAQAQPRTTAAPGLRDEFQRRGMTYFDTFVDPSSRELLTEQQLAAITQAVRRQVESMGRFENIRSTGISTESPQEFVRGLQAYLRENQESIARIRSQDMGIDYNFEYRDTIVTGEAMRQVLNSAYAYQVKVGALRISEEQEAYQTHAPRIVVEAPLNPAGMLQRPDLSATKLTVVGAIEPVVVFTSRWPMTEEEARQYVELVPGHESWQQAIRMLYEASQEAEHQPVLVNYVGNYFVAQFPITVEFYKIEVVDAQDNLVPAERAVIQVAQGVNSFRASGRQSGVTIAIGSEAFWDIAVLEGETIARQRAQESQELGRRQAIQNAGNDGPSAVAGIGVWIRSIPEFQIRAQIVESWDNNVSMFPGRSEDVRLDEWFRLYQEGEGGRRIDLGWTKVRRVGPGYRHVGGGQSAAREQRTELEIYTGDPEIGYMLGEYPTAGVQFDLRFAYNLLAGHSGDEANNLDSRGGHMLAGLFIGANLGPSVGFSEFYFGLEGGIGFGGDLFSWYAALQLGKKFLLARGATLLHVAINLGVTQYADISDQALDYRDTVLGLGSDNLISPLFALIEPRARIIYFLGPHFELYADISVRLAFGSTNEFEFGGTVPDDFSWQPIGIALGLGLSLSF